MIYPDYTKLRGPQFTEKHFRFHYPEFLEYINNKYPNIQNFQERLYWEAYGLTEAPQCYCGNPVVFEGFTKGYRKYCSRKCMNSDPHKKEQVAKTCMERYGGKAPASSPTVKQKSRATCIERFGCENPLQHPDIKKKVFGTIRTKYGGIGNESPILAEKHKATCLERYGVEYTHQCPEIMKKVQDTFVEKYGVTNPCILNPASHISRASQKFFEQLDAYMTQYNTQYGNKGGEYCIKCGLKRYFIDYYIHDLGIAVEFNGDAWHGNPTKYDDDDICIPQLKMTAKELQERDKKRYGDLLSLGIKSVVVWESEFTDDFDFAKLAQYIINLSNKQE